MTDGSHLSNSYKTIRRISPSFLRKLPFMGCVGLSSEKNGNIKSTPKTKDVLNNTQRIQKTFPENGDGFRVNMLWNIRLNKILFFVSSSFCQLSVF